MRNNLAITIIPGIICIGSVYFLNFGIIATTLLYNSDLVVGVANAMFQLSKILIPNYKFGNMRTSQPNSRNPEDDFAPHLNSFPLGRGVGMCRPNIRGLKK
jgi:hypothetical protein